jgi:hypothetical protein
MQGDQEGGVRKAVSKADDIRAVRGRLDAYYRQLEQTHRETEGKLIYTKVALHEAVTQLQEALRRHDAQQVPRLQKDIAELDAVRVGTEDALAGIERDAGQIAAEYRRQGENLRTPESIPFECPGCGADLVATSPRKLPGGRRGATYDCGGCDVIYSVSWGAAGDDVRARAA